MSSKKSKSKEVTVPDVVPDMQVISTETFNKLLQVIDEIPAKYVFQIMNLIGSEIQQKKIQPLKEYLSAVVLNDKS